MLSAVQSQVCLVYKASPFSAFLFCISVFIDPFVFVSSYQMGAVDTAFDDLSSLFDTGGSKGLTGELVEKIPKMTITGNNNTDASENNDSCSVCLQVLTSVCFVLAHSLYRITDLIECFSDIFSPS